MITMIGLLHDRGIDIGSEMSVISFDDIAVFRLLTPQVAIISQQAEDMGRQGVDMLLDMIINNDCSRGESRYVPSSFVGLLCGVFPDIAAFIRCMKAGFMR